MLLPGPLISQAKEHMHTSIIYRYTSTPIFMPCLSIYIENHAFTLILVIPGQPHNVHSGFLSTIVSHDGHCQWLQLPLIYVFIWSFFQWVTHFHYQWNVLPQLLWRHRLHSICAPTTHNKQLLLSDSNLSCSGSNTYAGLDKLSPHPD